VSDDARAIAEKTLLSRRGEIIVSRALTHLACATVVAFLLLFRLFPLFCNASQVRGPFVTLRARSGSLLSAMTWRIILTEIVEQLH